MTQNEQINKQLNEEWDRFLNEVYDSKFPVPSSIIDLFKKSIMSMPPFAHKIRFNKVRAISVMKPEELTNGLLQDIIKVILNTSLQKLYNNDGIHEEDFFRIIENQIQLEKFVLCYNNHVDDFRKKLEMKKATLESLSGARNNGLRIIPQA